MTSAQVSPDRRGAMFLRSKFAGNRTRGFTLIELLIAITITALLGVGTFAILNSGIRAKNTTHDRSAHFTAIQKVQRVLADDFQQIAARSVRLEYGDEDYAVTTRSIGTLVEFTRTGKRDAVSLLLGLNKPEINAAIDKMGVVPASNLQRIAYEWEDEVLTRVVWEVLDRSQDTQPLRQTLLTGVTEVKLSFLDENNEWSEDWPTQAALANRTAATLREVPKGVELRFQHALFGEIRRVFLIAGAQ